LQRVLSVLKLPSPSRRRSRSAGRCVATPWRWISVYACLANFPDKELDLALAVALQRERNAISPVPASLFFFNRIERGIAVRILGLVTRTHDSGLALLVDGIPIQVLEEERLNREKHTRKFPFRSLQAAFGPEGLDGIDVITTPWHMPSLRRSMFRAVFGQLPASLNLLPPNARPTQSTLMANMPMGLRYGLWWHFGMKRLPKIVQVRHHDAHAAMFFVSPFDEAAVAVMD